MMYWRLLVSVLVGVLIGTLQPTDSSALTLDKVTSSGNSFVGSTLAAPTAAAATVTGGNIKVSWTVTASAWATGYQVLRAKNAGGPFAQVAQVTPRAAAQYIDTGVTPGVAYYYRVHAYFGNWVSTDTAVVTGTVPVAVLAGSSAVQVTQANVAAGTAVAFLFTAASGGPATHLNAYLDAANTATTVSVALYADSAGSPGARLSTGIISIPAAGTWNTAVIPSVAVAAGTKYWIAILGPAGGNAVTFRDSAAGAAGSSQTSAQTNLATLPAAWSTGTLSAHSPGSAYVSP